MLHDKHEPKAYVFLRVSLGRTCHLSDQIVHAHGAKPWHYAAELRTLHILCVAWLLPTPRIIYLRSAQINLSMDTFSSKEP